MNWRPRVPRRKTNTWSMVAESEFTFPIVCDTARQHRQYKTAGARAPAVIYVFKLRAGSPGLVPSFLSSVKSAIELRVGALAGTYPVEWP